jgi:hypothetical protein
LDGDSDQLATAAADAKLRNSGIAPKTRLKLERIPVRRDDEGLFIIRQPPAWKAPVD